MLFMLWIVCTSASPSGTHLGSDKPKYVGKRVMTHFINIIRHSCSSIWIIKSKRVFFFHRQLRLHKLKRNPAWVIKIHEFLKLPVCMPITCRFWPLQVIAKNLEYGGFLCDVARHSKLASNFFALLLFILNGTKKFR